MSLKTQFYQVFELSDSSHFTYTIESTPPHPTRVHTPPDCSLREYLRTVAYGQVPSDYLHMGQR